MGAAAIPLMLAGTAYTAYSQYKSGQYNKEVNDRLAVDAFQRGQAGAGLAASRGTRAVGAATAAAASANVDVRSGSVVDVVGGTRMVSALDAATIRANALREAYGYRARGDLAEREGTNSAVGTLLTGAASAGMAAYQQGAFNTGAGASAPYYLAAPGQPYDPSTFPTFER